MNRVLFIPAAFLLAFPSLAQNITGTILGTVKDASGAPVMGAEASVTNTETNQTTRVATNHLGYYEAPYLRPGAYAVAVRLQGFKTAERRNVAVRVDARVRLDFALEVGDITTSVTVSGESPMLDSETASLGQVVTDRSIRDLPLLGRSVFDLAGLAAGVNINPQTASGGVGAYASFTRSDIAINGGRMRTNEFTVDGVSVMLPENNNYGFSPTPDGTKEFKVQTSSYGAQFGRSGGGVVNVVTRGGTNDLHGAVYEYFRNDRLQANSFFANARGQARGIYHFNLFGASAGGPIIRDKTFFFGEYQGHRQSSFGGAGVATLPTAAQRGGDFSEVYVAANQLAVIYDPFTTRTAPSGTGFVRTPFAGNRIPVNRFDRVASNMLKYYPLPNRPGEGPAQLRNYGYSPTNEIHSDLFSGRIDHRFSSSHSLFGRLTRTLAGDSATGPYKSVAENLTGAQNSNTVNAVLNTTYILAPTSLLNWRYGFTRRYEERVPYSAGKVNLTELGFPPYVAAAAQQQMFPTVAIGGYTQMGPPSADAIRRGNDIHTWVAEETEMRGRHTLVFGSDIRLYNQTPYQAGVPSGSYSFGKGQTQGPDPQRATLNAGDGFASYLLGFGTGSISNVPALAIRNYYLAVYANDEIKLGRLTLTLGLRYDYEQPRTERYNRFSTFDFDRKFPIAVPGLADLRGVIRWAGQDGEPRGQFDPAHKNFGPRAGLAFRLDKATVLRAGYGIYYAPRIGATNASSFGVSGEEISTSWVSSLDGVTPLNLWSDPYPTGLLLRPESEAERLLVGQGIGITDRGNKNNNYMQQWNFSVQRELLRNWMVEAAYSGSRGIRNTVRWSWNQLDPKYQALGPDLSRQVSNPFFGYIRTGALAQRTVAQSVLLRPYPQYSSVTTNWQNRAASTYHSLQAKAEKRFSHGFSLLLSYTAGKLIDDSSGRMFNYTDFTPPVQDYYNLRAERAVSTSDVSQRLVATHTWDLPLGRGKALLGRAPGAVNRIVGGWSASGTATFFTGFPLALTSSGNNGVGGGVQRPNSTGRSAKLSGDVQSRLDRFFDISAFTIPEPFTFGNNGRTLPDVRGPGRRNYDLSLMKNTRLTERFSLDFRTEFYNLTNTPYFTVPGTSLGSNTFGTIAGSQGARQLQVSLRLLW